MATVHKITGGDPSKGNMAVDTVHDLEIGQWVQFIHHGKSQEDGHFDPTSTKDTGMGIEYCSFMLPSSFIFNQY